MKTCDKCGRRIPDGGLAYDLRIAVSADFDGVLPASEEYGPERRRELRRRLDRMDPEAAMAEVHHEEHHLLCPSCRERFLANPLNLPLPGGLDVVPPPGPGDEP